MNDSEAYISLQEILNNQQSENALRNLKSFEELKSKHPNDLALAQAEKILISMIDEKGNLKSPDLALFNQQDGIFSLSGLSTEADNPIAIINHLLGSLLTVYMLGNSYHFEDPELIKA